MNRVQARAAAMKLIYEWEMGGDGGEDTLQGILEIDPGEAEYDYTQQVVAGVKENVSRLDELIAKYAAGWKLDRLTRVDLAILRLGAYELAQKQVPAGVVINEAVELSQIYSTDKAGAFVNGVLGGISRAEKD